MVRCRNLDAGYGETVILEDINLDIYRGEITALLGGSGSGKSTLLKTIIGLLPPISGSVEVLGKEPQALSEDKHEKLLQRTGVLFQYGALFGSKTVYENIALPLKQHTDLPEKIIEEMVRMRLALVGLEGIENRLPSEISGGQQKRVALARATIMDPEIVFADEPSAGLDPVIAAGLDKMLRTMQELFNVTMVIVTHELESIRLIADRVIMLSEGKVKAVGSVDELENSSDPEVSDFFARKPPNYVQVGRFRSVLDEIDG